MSLYPFRTYVTVNLASLQKNLLIAKELAGENRKVMQVLKADAYGHGVSKCAEYAAPYVDMFAVATLEEALAAREVAPTTPILLFGALQEYEIPKASEADITINLFSYSYAARVAEVLRRKGLGIKGHLKFETGMNRLGIRTRSEDIKPAIEEAKQIFSIPELEITGCYTHFSCADTDDESDIAFSNMQFRAFCEITDALIAEGYNVGIRHCASTGGSICHPEYKMDMIRTGMLGFGQCLSPESAVNLGLTPILTWYAKIIEIRDIPAGDSISYGRTYICEKDEKIAVLSVGYADGYSRAFSNKTEVLVNGKRCPTRGRICMDYTMVDITGMEDVHIGDDVVLLGRNGGDWISADELAQYVPGNTNGGVTTEILNRVKRVYIFDETSATS